MKIKIRNLNIKFVTGFFILGFVLIGKADTSELPKEFFENVDLFVKMELIENLSIAESLTDKDLKLAESATDKESSKEVSQ